MKLVCKSFLSCFLVVALLSCDNTSSNSQATAEKKNKEKFETNDEEHEAQFISDAVEQKFGEIKLAELASAKSSSKELQDFAQRMADDQTESLSKFQDLARKNGITIPVEESEHAKKKVNDLTELQGREFDKKWIDEIISKHEKTLREFEKKSEKFEDPQLIQILGNTNEKLHAQLTELHKLRENLK